MSYLAYGFSVLNAFNTMEVVKGSIKSIIEKDSLALFISNFLLCLEVQTPLLIKARL